MFGRRVFHAFAALSLLGCSIVRADDLASQDVAPKTASETTNDKAALAKIIPLIEEGKQLADTFLKTKDFVTLNAAYPEWSNKVEAVLQENFDRSYLVRYRNTPPISRLESGMALAGAGSLEAMTGKIEFLNNVVAELKHANERLR
jgi:hypothetical protein